MLVTMHNIKDKIKYANRIVSVSVFLALLGVITGQLVVEIQGETKFKIEKSNAVSCKLCGPKGKDKYPEKSSDKDLREASGNSTNRDLTEQSKAAAAPCHARTSDENPFFRNIVVIDESAMNTQNMIRRFETVQYLTNFKGELSAALPGYFDRTQNDSWTNIWNEVIVPQLTFSEYKLLMNNDEQTDEIDYKTPYFLMAMIAKQYRVFAIASRNVTKSRTQSLYLMAMLVYMDMLKNRMLSSTATESAPVGYSTRMRLHTQGLTNMYTVDHIIGRLNGLLEAVNKLQTDIDRELAIPIHDYIVILIRDSFFIHCSHPLLKTYIDGMRQLQRRAAKKFACKATCASQYLIKENMTTWKCGHDVFTPQTIFQVCKNKMLVTALEMSNRYIQGNIIPDTAVIIAFTERINSLLQSETIETVPCQTCQRRHPMTFRCIYLLIQFLDMIYPVQEELAESVYDHIHRARCQNSDLLNQMFSQVSCIVTQLFTPKNKHLDYTLETFLATDAVKKRFCKYNMHFWNETAKPDAVFYLLIYTHTVYSECFT